jgi:hypothetical protein
MSAISGGHKRTLDRRAMSAPERGALVKSVALKAVSQSIGGSNTSRSSSSQPD